MELDPEIEAVGDALRYAETKHPNYPKSLHRRMSILTEEIGEVAKAILDYEDNRGDVEDIKHELRQSAAMCFRFLKHLNKEEKE